jgi:hypothetical protein
LSASDLEIMATTGTVEIPAQSLGSNPSETSFEMPVLPPAPETSTSLAADTTIIPGATPGVPAQFPGYPPPAQSPYGTPGYPAAYPGYGQPQQPMGYPQQPMAYPGQYPGYAPQAYPTMPGYPMQMPYTGYAPPPSQSAPAPDPNAIAVKLPPPDQTGVKAPAPAPAASTDAAGAPKTEEKPSNTAADIIKSYMQRKKS